MNERIQELAEEAEIYADSIVELGGEFHEEYTKKLAELIVRECIANCDDLNSMKYIANHFGIQVKGLNDDR